MENDETATDTKEEIRAIRSLVPLADIDPEKQAQLHERVKQLEK
jgi:hypothetical protein